MENISLGGPSQETTWEQPLSSNGLPRPQSEGTPQPISQATGEAEYIELRRRIKGKGLLDRQPAYYTWKILSTLGMMGLSLTCLVMVDTLWVQLLNAVFMAFVFTQLGMIGHDAGHQQIFGSMRKNDMVLLGVSFLIALSPSWWIDKHNRRHHSNPNNLDYDFDVNLPLMAFTEKQALGMKGFYRAIVKYQSSLVSPLLFLEGISIRLDSAQYIMRRRKVKYPVAESIALATHMILYFGLLFYFLSAWHAVFFIIVHQALIGLYMGSVFATNHKGMLMLDGSSRMDFLRRQVLTSRNVNANPLTNLWYGGLNYQIEHHLFPTMPRNKLGEARKIVKPFCEERGISYCEMGVARSYREVIYYLHKVSAPLRQKKAVSPS